MLTVPPSVVPRFARHIMESLEPPSLMPAQMFSRVKIIDMSPVVQHSIRFAAIRCALCHFAHGAALTADPPWSLNKPRSLLLADSRRSPSRLFSPLLGGRGPPQCDSFEQ
ncbi:unnamed protein product [Rangifer tarandus platyrhynchus]|uniref:Uncharacterized protein n=1 Tax=Rangifer tarandus platyrhynchus TaxID=3082113 RepID=A0ABN8XJP9_RANTA|nr:unnamed protein product [Rangifer tarandus platyrhynchus]